MFRLKSSRLRFPLMQSFILNYLLFNRWLLKNTQIDISNYKFWILEQKPVWFIIFLFNMLILIFFLFKKIKLDHSIIYYLSAIFIFQLLNISNLPNAYFWETIPDSNTYRLLGETLIECGRLALDCDETSMLQWPFGQPLISGILSKYFYNLAKYIYLLIFIASIWFISMLSHKNYGNYFAIGITYFTLLPNNYELSSLIISEIPYLLFTSMSIFYLNQRIYNLSFIFSVLSFFVRPIGIINLFMFLMFLFFKKRNLIIKYICILFLVFLTYMTYNLLINQSFVVSTTVTTNIQGDGFIDSDSSVSYFYSFFNNNFLDEIVNNLSRLYGEGSRNCSFSNCYFYNPLFNSDGTVPSLLDNTSRIGQIINPIVIRLFEITSPLKYWVFIPFLFLFCFSKKNIIDNIITSTFALNVFFSLLTYEYGSRWWLLPNLLSIYLLTALFSKSKKIINKTIFTKAHE